METDVGALGWVAEMAIPLVFFFVMDTVFMGLLWRIRNGRVEVTRDDRHAFRVMLSDGSFTLDRMSGVLHIDRTSTVAKIPVDQIERFDFSLRSEVSLASEWIRGMDFWDLHRKYTDVIEWREITVVTNDGPLSLFEVGQYSPRGWMSDRLFAFQARLLGRFGLYEDADEKAEQALNTILKAFKDSAYDVSMTPRWVKDKQRETSALSA